MHSIMLYVGLDVELAVQDLSEMGSFVDPVM